ncbi:MAG: SagB/ThcOx family dehydrogenase [Firmicutes bacterium]|nr:SagB/ThcOx family dehydrogenase [Bacillota bacterium]
MKSSFGRGAESDQNRGLAQPPLQKPRGQKAETIELPLFGEDLIVESNVFRCIAERRSRRDFKDEALALAELSYLLWATQGVQEIKGDNYATLRPVPSGGARHAYETYLALGSVEGLQKGLYRYLPIEHSLLFLYQENNLAEKIKGAAGGQDFAGKAAVNFIWACLPYRGEWRYAESSHKVMLLDAGHIGQALYLACQSLGLGNCALAAYDQQRMDELIQVDGKDEFTVYMSAVGRV